MPATTAAANIGTITQKALAGSITADNKVYDSTDAATLASRALSGVYSGDAVSYNGGTAKFADKNAGNGKSVTASGLGLSGADAGNYTVNTTATATADITQALLNIIADDKSKTAGLPNPIFTASYSGFVPNEDQSVLSGTLDLVTTATTLSSAGDYPIKPSGVSSTNYVISYKDGTLHVDPANSGGNDVGIREIAGILSGTSAVPSGLNRVAALNALPGTAAGGEGGEVIPGQFAPSFLAGNVAVVVCGIALPSGVEADSRCQIR